MKDQGIAERIKKIRFHFGLSQQAISDRLDWKKPKWQGYETGSNVPGGLALKELAELGVNLHWLLTGQGPMIRSEEPKVGYILDEELFLDIVASMEEYMAENKIKVSPQKRGLVYLESYKSTMKGRARRAREEIGPDDEYTPNPEDFTGLVKLAEME